MPDRWSIWIDVGGTFTDCIGLDPAGGRHTLKVLSSGAVKGRCAPGTERDRLIDPRRAADPPGFYTGWTLHALDERGRVVDRRIVASFDADRGALTLDRPPSPALRPGAGYELSGDLPAPILAVRLMMRLPPGEPIGAVSVRLGTTRGTNALLERKGAAVGYLTTAGFADLLEIGTQARPELFKLRIEKRPPLHRAVAEVAERIDAAGRVLRPLDEADVRRALAALRDTGCAALAVCLLNAYANPAHERAVRRLAERAGFEHISASTDLSPTINALDRGDTAVLDAYLSPVIRRYVCGIGAHMPEGRLTLMTSAGALVDAGRFVGKDSLLSGPAGGVVGFAHVARRAGFERAIGFDMGGTSTDVSRFGGAYEYRYTDEVAGVRVISPAYDIRTVAAGGGSICRFDGQRLTVGPDSAGADPGPACYGCGGPLSVTDVNLFNGKIDAARFPFPLDRRAVESRLTDIAGRMEQHGSPPMSPHEIADGFTRVANLKMAAAIKQVSAARGYDPAGHVLVAFGGAAAQHAGAIARSLGIGRILLHPMAGVLSAYGIGMADVTRFAERSVLKPLNERTLAGIEHASREMAEPLRERIIAEGIAPQRIDPPRRLLDLRYAGQQTPITVPEPPEGDWAAAFTAKHRQLYGHAHEDRPIEVATLRVEVTGRTDKPVFPTAEPADCTPLPEGRRTVFFDAAAHDTALYDRAHLRPGDRIEGPAIVTEPYSTIVIDPGWRAIVTERFDLLLTDESKVDRPPRSTGPAGAAAARSSDDRAEVQRDPLRLELFNNHFTHIATQMGLTLQRTAVSVNVKHRLDFSCAILDAAGHLVVNAPHIPVHLGAMGESVKGLLREVGDLRAGDVYLTNDPDLGGSHLPDLTVITPVFDPGGERLLFFAASRAHHAEIGGLRPGSAFPFAARLAEEGVVIRMLRIVRAGRFDERALRRALTDAPHPSRAPEENIADVRAAVAANHLGATELLRLIDRDSWPLVRAYMGYIRDAAEARTRAAIARLDDGDYELTDVLDDGAPLRLKLEVRGEMLTIDFTGTGPVNPNSLNANRAIIHAALIYCLRCLIDEDIPLNWGVMQAVELVLPHGMLNPPPCADPMRHPAVVGGNVELSQRIVDLFFGALGVLAASQGTMNNLVFGDDRFGYYETICGGAGAGRDFDGASAVHTHMTNTRLTDVEVLERQYPIRVRRFAVRRGSGGAGRHRGGDGVVRRIEFLRPVRVSLLTQRRVIGPFGLAGGRPGQPGRNLLCRAGADADEDLGPLAQLDARAGDVLSIETPGGGGYGRPVG